MISSSSSTRTATDEQGELVRMDRSGVTRAQSAVPPTESEIVASMRAEGLTPHGWGNGPGDRYGWHDHAYHKVLYCVRGSIIFHTDEGDLPLAAGDRLDLPSGTRHAATVGDQGVRCVEAPR
jgi:mannose-6-phosphate isomerase-like protein (cupin superfamily)